MTDRDEKREQLVRELLDYFSNANYETLAARNIAGFAQPEAIHNDGYGDQEDKRPDVIAFDESEQCFLLGIARTGEDDLESEGSLTEYNVFLDERDKKYHNPYRLYIIAPANRMSELTALITHYIHRDYWHRITFVSSHIFQD